MSKYAKYPSISVLKNLSKEPIDLSKKGSFTSKRIEKMQANACGFSLLYGSERVTDDVLNALIKLANEAKALEKMEEMQSGEVINKIEGFESENRSVLHTAMRDFFEDKNSDPRAKDAAKLAYKEVEKLKAFLATIKDHYTDIVQIGIGGSDLGPRALYVALKAFSIPGRKAHFISNVDPDDAIDVLNHLPLEKTLFVVVSKSGTTLETLTNESFVKDYLKKKGLNPKNHLLSVTGEGSPMDDTSKYLESFYIWDYVGGRYSATSMVGGVMLGFCLGFDNYLALLKGASKMDKHALSKDCKNNLPLLSALLGIWNRNFLDLPTVAIIPYSQALLRFPAHLQQCDMESNGKQINKQGMFIDFQSGPIIWGEPGTNGQHSFYQLIHQGTTIVPLEFIGFKHSQYKQDLLIKETTSQEKLLANLFAQSIALAGGHKSDNPNKTFLGNRPNRILLGSYLNPESMGALLSYYEHKVAFQGFIWGINSFDQEGVQLGKVLANQILDHISSKRTGKKVEPFETAESYLKILERFS